MKKYVFLSVLATIQVFYIAADYNNDKSKLQQQLNVLSTDLSTLDKLNNEYPSSDDAARAINTQIGFLLIKTRSDLKAALDQIEQIKKLKLSSQQSNDFQTLTTNFNQLQKKWTKNYSNEFSPIDF